MHDRCLTARGAPRALLFSLLGVTVLMLLAPLVMGIANVSYVSILVIFGLLALGLASAEMSTQGRSVVLGLFWLGTATRLVILVVLHVLAGSDGGPFLGPDSTAFLHGSQQLAADGFRTSVHPIQTFGDFAVAHYYVFAGAIRYLEADLFSLQLLNCCFTALVGPLMFSVTRLTVPAAAFPLGIIVTLFPSLITLSALDLLKDPSVLFFTTLAVWAGVRLLHAQSTGARAAWALVGCVSLLYLRLDRFYVAAYLEGAVILAVLFGLLTRRNCLRSWRPLIWLLVVLAVAEVVPTRLGWPGSPSLMSRSFGWALEVPQLRDYGPGLLDRTQLSEAEVGADVIQGGGDSTDGTNEGLARVDSELGSGRAGWPWYAVAIATIVLSLAVPCVRRLFARRVEHLVLLAIALGGVGSVLVAPTFAANIFRRLYGPFVWIMPSEWSIRHILTYDYLMYPGMLLWYFLLPFMLLGLVGVGWRVLKREALNPDLVGIWAFTVIYCAQYLLFNFSYRHRETLFPFLLIFGFLGLPILERRRWRWAYGGYWMTLLVVAIWHLVTRARFAVS